MRILILMPLVLLAACAAPAGEPSPSLSPMQSPDPTEEATPVEESPSPTLQPSLSPVEPELGGEGVLTGLLGADAIEGGCAYLQTPDRTRYEVIYPDGWELRMSPLELISPQGEVVATGGDSVSVRGSEAGDMASICQIGPIFRAAEVLTEP
ncbi:MAG: hypothetical protein ACRDGV_02700 [Candidatus Limnocylindria bacterium]